MTAKKLEAKITLAEFGLRLTQVEAKSGLENNHPKIQGCERNCRG